jgi:hypothetical protein
MYCIRARSTCLEGIYPNEDAGPLSTPPKSEWSLLIFGVAPFDSGATLPFRMVQTKGGHHDQTFDCAGETLITVGVATPPRHVWIGRLEDLWKEVEPVTPL